MTNAEDSQAEGPSTDHRFYALRRGSPAEYLGRSIAGTAMEGATEIRSGRGLGIDAGGTYTDAVLFDFERRRVLASAKSLTTRSDPAVGIGRALDSLPRELFTGLSRVSLATTFATNAIVEGKGRKVGLLLAGYDDYDLAGIGHSPRLTLKGRHDIMGRQTEELDTAEVESAVRALLEEEGVEAFAVASVGACRNPEHEGAIKAIIRRSSSLPVVMGHELSSELDRILRANTAALNARISPLIVELGIALERELAKRGIATPLTIVRADGSLMNLSEACEKPIEMILSGPAASTQGALALAGLDEAIVVDMGGTTSDVAITARGRPVMSGRGAVIGEHRTAVRTLKSSSIGLGGDSEIRIERGEIRVGPRRILPSSYAASIDPRIRKLQEEIASSPLAELELMHPAQVFILLSEPANLAWLEPREIGILEALREGPQNILSLSRALDYPFLSCIPLKRLEDFGFVMRSGLSPTDLLHAEGTFTRWDARAAIEALAHFSSRLGLSVPACIERIRAEISAQLVRAVVVEAIADSGRPRRESELAVKGLGERFWAGAVSGRPDGALSYSMRLDLPIIGVGAPMAAFLPELADLLGTSAICPEHADIAGAIGSLLSSVSEELDFLIRKKAEGGWALFGADFKKDFKGLAQAKEAAMSLALEGIVQKAASGGLEGSLVEVLLEDNFADIAEGRLFMETRIHASARAFA